MTDIKYLIDWRNQSENKAPFLCELSYDNPNTVVTIFLQTLSTTAVCVLLVDHLKKKKKHVCISHKTK